MSCKSAIMASKMFKSSPRKKNILAAMENPINQELLVQLAEYIGDEDKKLLNAPKPKAEVDSKPEITDESDSESVGAPTVSPIRPTGGRTSRPIGEDRPEGKPDGDAEPIDPYADVPDEVLDAPLAQSAKVSGKPIKASLSGGIIDGYSYESQINNLSCELKGTLNARQDTTGVSRVRVKDGEIWVYYDDSINLNTVLPKIIDALNAASYQYVEFNRLARTENAVVFTLEFNDTNNEMQAVSSEK